MATWDDIGKLVDWFDVRTGPITDRVQRQELERQFFEHLNSLTPEQLRRGCQHFAHVGWKQMPTPLAFRELCEASSPPATLEQQRAHVERIRKILAPAEEAKA